MSMPTIQTAAAKMQNDLAPLVATTPPAVLKAAAPVLLRAQLEGNAELYAQTLDLVKSADASALLAPLSADAGNTKDERALSLGLTQQELATLETLGMSVADIVRLYNKYPHVKPNAGR